MGKSGNTGSEAPTWPRWGGRPEALAKYSRKRWSAPVAYPLHQSSWLQASFCFACHSSSRAARSALGHDGRPAFERLHPTFEFENYEPSGTGPESLQAFVDACLGRPYYTGADAQVGLATVRALDAMYRSALSGQLEQCH